MRGGVLSFLAFLSCFTIGFSSWQYGEHTADNKQLNIEIGNFVNLSTYLTTPVVEYFEVCPTGLVVDETIVYAGNIVINTNLKLKDGLLSNYDNSCTNFDFRFILITNGTFNYFTSDYMGSITPGVDYSFYLDGYDPIYTTTISNINNNIIESQLSLSNDSLQTINNINLSIVYKFDFTMYKSNFNTSIYENLGNNPLSFMINMEIQ